MGVPQRSLMACGGGMRLNPPRACRPWNDGKPQWLLPAQDRAETVRYVDRPVRRSYPVVDRTSRYPHQQCRGSGHTHLSDACGYEMQFPANHMVTFS